jgi:hypothetical protein
LGTWEEQIGKKGEKTKNPSDPIPKRKRTSPSGGHAINVKISQIAIG